MKKTNPKDFCPAMIESLESRELFSVAPGFGGGVSVAGGDVNGDSATHAAKHSGGANMIFCDGSVRFVNSSISQLNGNLQIADLTSVAVDPQAKPTSNIIGVLIAL